MLDLVIADCENRAESRIRDIVLLRLEPDEFTVWLWAEALRRPRERGELYLFNLAPPFGHLPVNLGQLNWDWCCEGLAVFKLIPSAFELHFGDARIPSTSVSLEAGQTLRDVLRSIPAACSNNEPLFAAVEIACLHGSFARSTKSLQEFLEEIVVPDLRSTVSTRECSAEVSLDDKLRAVRRVSLWTPGTSEIEFIAFYAPLVGEVEARRLWTISRTSIAAVAAGEFEKQVVIGSELASLVPSNSILAGEAAYFKGEGFRLLADIEPLPERKEDLRAQAVEQYAKASALLVNDPRPLRALGRITELRGDFDGALKYFKIAKGLCLSEMSRDSVASQLDLAHEILRTTRHFIHCLLDVRETNPGSVWHRVQKEQELQGYLQECENLHFEHMPRFQVEPEWYYIEWFMGFVFLAKAWGSLGKFAQMQRMLVNALDARRRILRPSTTLSSVERANIEWWLAVAKTGTAGFEPGFTRAIDRLEVAIAKNDAASVGTAIEDLVGPFVPPWSSIPKHDN